MASRPGDGERYVVYIVPGADDAKQSSFRRYRTVAAALLVSAAVIALAAARSRVNTEVLCALLPAKHHM